MARLAIIAVLLLAAGVGGGAYFGTQTEIGETFFHNGMIMGSILSAVSLTMLWSSVHGKFQMRDTLVGWLAPAGVERVLDVGCGRGLALIAVAKRLTGGKAVGLDLWSAKDLSGNNADATLANAAAEGVADRVIVETGDMCAMPFADASFDAVISMTAIHNVPGKANRDKALHEIVRVLKPGGRLAIYDIFYVFGYGRVLKDAGMVDVRGSAPVFLWWAPGRYYTARKPG